MTQLGTKTMNLDKVAGIDDGALWDDPEVREILSIRRRNSPLRFNAVKKLVTALQAGKKRRANLEAYGREWRLRFSLRDENGGIRRKSIVIVDPLTAEWVQNFLASARKERANFKYELWSKRFRDPVTGKDSMDELAVKILTALGRCRPGNDVVTGNDHKNSLGENDSNA